jgi:hypothetical protein
MCELEYTVKCCDCLYSAAIAWSANCCSVALIGASRSALSTLCSADSSASLAAAVRLRGVCHTAAASSPATKASPAPLAFAVAATTCSCCVRSCVVVHDTELQSVSYAKKFYHYRICAHCSAITSVTEYFDVVYERVQSSTSKMQVQSDSVCLQLRGSD